MKKILLILCFFSLFLYSYDKNKNYDIKNYHKNLSLTCKHCHGNKEKKDYKKLDDSHCLSCHKSKDFLADRLGFMGKANPHNSIHDGTLLYCSDCHNSHKPSYNMCMDCHNTKRWMKDIK